MRAFTDEQLEKLLRSERARVIHAVLHEIDARDHSIYDRLRARIVGLLAVLDSPTGESNNGREQTGGKRTERPEFGRSDSEGVNPDKQAERISGRGSEASNLAPAVFGKSREAGEVAGDSGLTRERVLG